MFNWGIRQDTKAVNAIILGEGSEKGRPFKARFLQAGLVKYDFGVCLLQKETIDKFIDTFKGCPVIINHKDNITEADKVGVVQSIWFSEQDGWFWCDGVLTDDRAVKLVENGYNVSCQYAITDYSINNDGKLHNGNPYDKEILNGLFEHLAIVDNPRYEGAYIAVNAYIAQNAICITEKAVNGEWITVKPNGEGNTGRHLYLKDGENVYDAMRRQWGAQTAGQQHLFSLSKYKSDRSYQQDIQEKIKQFDAEKIKEKYAYTDMTPEELEELAVSFEKKYNTPLFKTAQNNIEKYQPVFDWIRNFEGGTMDKETKGLFESLIDALKARNEADAEKDKEEKEAENKKAKNEDVDKRDIIRQIMAIAGKREDDEDVRTIAKLAEKLAYDKSEAGTADNKAKNEDDEKEEKKDDEKKDEASNKCKNKAKNEDTEEKEEKEEKYEELKDDVKEEAENKKAKNAIDEAVNKLYSALVPEPEDVFISEKKGLELGKQIYG